MNANPVAWFEIYVQEMNRAIHFYESVLQVKLTQLNAPLGELQMWSFPSNMEGYGTGGALVKMDGCPSGGSGTLVYLPRSNSKCNILLKECSHGKTLRSSEL